MGKKHEETKDMVREAISQLRRGDTLDALTTLERIFPKWDSVAASHADYLHAIRPAASAGEAG